MRREKNAKPVKTTFVLIALSVTALALVLESCGAPEADSVQPDETRRPNILFIMTDQQHSGMMSCTGNQNLNTPALDTLASTGIRFELAHATNPVCVPSRFSLQTGRMPSAIGLGSNRVETAVPQQWSEASLGPMLRQAGYRCAYAGKVHLPRQLDEYSMANGYELLTRAHRDNLATECSGFFEQPHDRPFFLFVSFINPHDIAYMAINDLARHEGRSPVDNRASSVCAQILEQAHKGGDLDAFVRDNCPPLPDNFAIPEKEPDSIGKLQSKQPGRRYTRNTWSENDWRLHRWLYSRLTERVDAQIGDVLQGLKDAGLEENTLVIFTSDHGDMDAAHRLESKGVLYEESIRVPFLMSLKGVIPAGRVDREHLVSTGLDLLPTLCDYAGVEVPGDLVGRSLRPLAEGSDVKDWRTDLVVENFYGRMIRTREFKYSVFAHGERREMLVDMQSDPGEMTNLADSPRHRDELNRHRRLLLDWIEQSNDKTGMAYAIKPNSDN